MLVLWYTWMNWEEVALNTRLRNNNLADNTTALGVKFHLTLLIGIVTLSYQFDFFLRLDNL